MLIFPTMSMSGPKMGWRAPAACRISSSAKQHLTRLQVVHFCILRAFGALQVRAAWSLYVKLVWQVRAGRRKKFGGNL
jgi:hypothetical protein